MEKQEKHMEHLHSLIKKRCRSTEKYESENNEKGAGSALVVADAIPIEFDYQKLVHIGFAVNCFHTMQSLEQNTLSCDEWAMMERQYMLACVSESGFGTDDRKGLIETGFECIKNTLTSCIGIEEHKTGDD